MELIAYEKLIRCENSARKYLLGFCWKNHQRFCPRCLHRKLYPLSSGRRRCARCKYTFHDFSRRFLNIGNLSPQDWLRVIKLFELEVPQSVIAVQTGLAPNTVAKALNTIRLAIAAQALDAHQLYEAGLARSVLKSHAPAHPEADDSGWPPVFGLVEQGGLAFLDILPDLTVNSLIHFKRNFRLRTAALGSVVYTDRFAPYLSLLVSGPQDIWQDWQGNPVTHRDKGLAVDATQQFWRFAKERLRRYRGIAPERFPLYLKELEFRYNHRNADIFAEVSRLLCTFVPDLG
ncbi:MAG: transposase [Oceanidesulfovibrio sp.]